MISTADHRIALLESALHYARRGWPVFPLHTPVTFEAGPACSCHRGRACQDVGKHPRYRDRDLGHGVLDATTDESTIQRWWETWPDANIGIRTGAPSGVVVVDVDRKPGADERWAALVAEHGGLPRTPESLTGSGGRHLLFRHPGSPIPSRDATLGFPGVDVKGDGGYIVAPPSVHRSGRHYEWELSSHPDEMPVAPLPAWLLTRLTGRAVAAGKDGDGLRAGEGWARLLQGVSEGERHEALCRIAGHFLGRGLPPDEIEEILLGFATRCRPPHDPKDVRRVVRDLAARDGAKQMPPGDVEPLGIGLGEFLAQRFPPLEPIVEGLLYTDGGGWIGGEEKLGKSYYAVEEALSIALGLPVCGRFTVPRRRRVFFLEEEDPPRRLHARINALLRGKGVDPTSPALLAELDQWMRLAVWTGFSFDAPGLVDRLEATCRTFRPAVIYGDVLRKLSFRDLNKSSEAGALLATLDRLRRDYAVVFRMLHHYRKTQGFRAGRGSQELGGSFQLGAWAEQSLYFEPIGRRHGAVRVDAQSKDTPPVPGFKLVFEAEGPPHDPVWVRLRAEDLTESSVRERNLEAVLQALGAVPVAAPIDGAPGVLVADLMATLKLSDKTIRACLKDLAAAGRAAPVGRASKGAALWAATGQ